MQCDSNKQDCDHIPLSALSSFLGLPRFLSPFDGDSVCTTFGCFGVDDAPSSFGGLPLFRLGAFTSFTTGGYFRGRPLFPVLPKTTFSPALLMVVLCVCTNS
eukprot:TRINITY_DN529_c0_g1_i5.p2 TRINITY_DN529_c0_g1~~TRINITY_DN529_c0_g1_i5.p2  ORF type:complete len:102 (+),score=0.05 TRINITY_DN529_c0_g1_i5:271-576(+)